MPDIAENIREVEWIQERRRIMFIVSGASTNDTITLSDYTTILGCCLMKNDGSSIAHSISGNVITITEAGLSSVDLNGFAIVS